MGHSYYDRIKSYRCRELLAKSSSGRSVCLNFLVAVCWLAVVPSSGAWGRLWFRVAPWTGVVAASQVVLLCMVAVCSFALLLHALWLCGGVGDRHFNI